MWSIRHPIFQCSHALQASEAGILGGGPRRIAMDYPQAVGQEVIDTHVGRLARQSGPHAIESSQHLPGGGTRVVLRFNSPSDAAKALHQRITSTRDSCIPQLVPRSQCAAAQPRGDHGTKK